MGQSLNQPQTLDQWTAWFRTELAPSDLDEAGLLSFMHHFADLGILEPIGENRWKIGGVDFNQSPSEIRAAVKDGLETLSLTKEGFAVACFLGQQPQVSSLSAENPQSQKPHRIPVEGNIPNREKASDLSNLQIVKKVGRQLKPFLDFERETLSRLQGSHTQQKDARKIFNFILRQTQGKAEPKKWEQLSRKRHK